MKNRDRRTLIVRIVAIVMAVLMVLGIATMLFQTVFAADGMPATGSSARSKLPIYILVGAIAVIAVVALIPMLKKKQ